MKKKLSIFLDGMGSIFSIFPQFKHHKANYVKKSSMESHSELINDNNNLAKNMQKILTQDLEKALDQAKVDLGMIDQEKFNALHKLHKDVEKYYKSN